MRLLPFFLFFLSAFITGALSSSGQAHPDTALLLPDFKEYHFALPEKAIEIKWIEYEKSKVPMHGRLSPDSSAIILRNYRRGESLRVRVVLSNGTIQEYVKSPCTIDPVIHIL